MSWNNDNGKGPNKDSEQGPPDLDEAFKKFFGALFKNKNSNSGGFNNNGGAATQGEPNNKLFWLTSLIIVIALVIIWALAGIYVVKPAEQGVVLHFGKYEKTVGPGPHWIPLFINKKYVVNVDENRSITENYLMLTSNENIVQVSFAVQYKIGNLKDYLFNVQQPESGLSQIIDSAVRQVIGRSTLDDILTVGRARISNDVTKVIETLDEHYKNGIHITQVAMQPASAPEQVKAAFDDVIKAREDKVRFENEATAYANNKVPVAQGYAQRILQEANATKEQTILKAQGQVSQFDALLSQFKKAPKVTAERMYLETMENVLNKSHVVVVDNGDKNGNVFYLPLGRGYAPQQATVKQAPPLTPETNVSSQTPKVSTVASTNATQQLKNAYIRWQEAQKNAY